MNQFETIAVPPRIPGERLSGRASLLVHGDRFWRLVPALFVAAAYALPTVAAFVSVAGTEVVGGEPSQTRGGPLEMFVRSVAGSAGVLLVAAAIAGLMSVGVWLLARALDAPRWAAALVASAVVVAPVVGLAPAPIAALDDAAFGALVAAACGLALKAGRNGRDAPLALAFVAATLAAAVRPGAAWPAFAVVAAAYAVLRARDERLIYGLISSLAWAPGIALFKQAFDVDAIATTAAGPSASLVGAGVRSGVQAVAGWGDILTSLALVVPFLALAIAAGVGLLVALRPRTGRDVAAGVTAQNVALAAVLFIGFTLLGALGAGGLQAGRLALDPLLWGAAGALGTIVPALARRFKTARAQPA
jgi:hypothetical protein